MSNTAPRVWHASEAHFSTAITDNWYKLIFGLSTLFVKTTNHFFESEGIDPVLLPVTVNSVSSPMGKGSDSLPVRIELFGKKTYLADSMQFQLEYLLRMADKGVYYVMPTFRGEDPSERHLNQFFHSEVEIKGGFAEITALAERYMLSLTEAILDKYGDQFRILGIGTDHLERLLSLRLGFPSITYEEATRIVAGKPGCMVSIGDGISAISPNGEKEIMNAMGGICWLINHPANIVPFYQARNEQTNTCCCGDLLCGIGEILGMGERHQSYENTLGALKENEVALEEYTWYLKMKDKYPMKTAGFGLGMERFLLWVLKHHDIRDIPLLQRLKSFHNEP